MWMGPSLLLGSLAPWLLGSFAAGWGQQCQQRMYSRWSGVDNTWPKIIPLPSEEKVYSIPSERYPGVQLPRRVYSIELRRCSNQVFTVTLKFFRSINLMALGIRWCPNKHHTETARWESGSSFNGYQPISWLWRRRWKFIGAWNKRQLESMHRLVSELISSA